MKRRMIALALLATLAATAAAATPPRGQVLEVPGEFPDLLTAISSAGQGDTILLAPGTYSGENNRNLDIQYLNLVILSEAGPEVTIIDCEQEGLAFHIHGGFCPVEIRGLTIRNGTGMEESGYVKGGAIFVRETTVGFYDLRIENCSADFGGGICLAESEGSTLERIRATGNSCIESGAAMILSGGYATFSHCEFLDNDSAHYGGGIALGNQASASLDSCRIEGNSSDRRGGGIYAYEASVQIHDSQVLSCQSETGGGIYIAHSTTSLLRNVLATGNFSSEDGSAVLLNDAEATFSHCTFAQNDTNWGGGGICLDYESVAWVEYCIFAYNSAGGGGAIYCRNDGNLVGIICSDAYSNTPDHYGNFTDPTGLNGNITADPEFCGSGNPEQPFTIGESSPCASANNKCGELIGAFGVGCGTFHTLAGQVEDAEGLPIEGVRIHEDLPRVFTDEFGQFQMRCVEGWTGSLQPFLIGYGFTPFEYAVEDLAGDILGIEFLGEAITGPVLRVPSQFPTLASAVEWAADGDTILVAPGTYSGQGNINVDLSNKSLAVVSEEGSETTIIDCEGNGRAFESFSEYTEILIRGFTILDGVAHDDASDEKGGAVCIQETEATLEDLCISGCLARYGGAIAFVASTGSQVKDVTCFANASHRDGAALYIGDSNLTVRGSTFADNSTTWGGGGIALKDGGYLLLYNTLIAFNSASAGGGIYFRDEGNEMSGMCNDVFGNGGGNYGECEDLTGTGLNISANPLLCDWPNGDLHVATGSPCLPENNACNGLIGTFGEGCDLATPADESAPAPFALAAVHPNPFNPSTQITFTLPEAGPVTLTVYDVGGRRVAQLLENESLEAGPHELTWTARNLSSGVYLVHLAARGESATQKALLVK